REVRFGGAPRSFPRERPDVKLVDHLSGKLRPAPGRVAPRERARIDDTRSTVRAFGLEARARIGERIGVVEPQTVERACRRGRREPGKISATFGRELDLFGLEHDPYARCVRGPDAKMDTATRDFGADGQTPSKC